MELKEGMYVRTKDGNIGEITFISPLDGLINLDTESYSIGKHYIEKASYNIIDLIEVGDYVNGYPVYEIVEYEDNTRAIVIADDNKSIIWEKSSKFIKSIVTKEQFESMSYKVGD